MSPRLIHALLVFLMLASFASLAADKKTDKTKDEKKSAADAGPAEEPEPAVEEEDDGLPGIGTKAPSFLLKDSNGVYHRLSDSEGNVLLLVFFRTDCEPCLVVMQQVVAFYLSYRDEVDVLAIALLERPNGRLKLDEYLEGARLPFPVLVDKDDEVAKKYIMKGSEATLPALFFIDEEGVVTQRLHRLSMSLDSYLEEE